MEASKVSEAKFKVPGLLPARKKKQPVPPVPHQDTVDISSLPSQQASTVGLDEDSLVVSKQHKQENETKESSGDDPSEHLDTEAENKPVSVTTTEEQSSVESKENEQIPSDGKAERPTQSKAQSHSSAHERTSDQSFPPLPYTEPHWSASPTEPYFLSVIKNGTVVQEINISTKPFHVFGRLPCCDVPLDHPSLSRYHAVLQYHPHIENKSTSDEELSSTLFSTNPKEAGFYVYDLGSTHGTFINKSQVNPRCYYRLRVGQMVKFGGSSRMFLLEHGTGSQAEVEADAEAEIKDILEKKEAMKKKQEEAEATRERLAKERENMGAMWGMLMEDASGEAMEEEYEIDPEREAYYVDDPKRALKKFFDREGLELEYETGEEGPSRSKVYTCRVRLPIDTATGESLYAEASVQGKKKDAVLQCALNACRILDAHDILRHQSQRIKRKERDWEGNDYYDSDEDTFLDRTGSIEVKRQHRMKKAGVQRESIETYKSLQEKLRLISTEISDIEKRLKRDQQVNANEQEDDLEMYMKNVSHHLDASKKTELKQNLHALRKEEERVTKLISVARPTQMPMKTNSDSESVNTVRDIHIEKRRENVVPRSKAKIHQSKGIPKSVEGIDDERKPPVDSSLKQRPMKSFSSDGTAVTPARQFPLKTVEQTIGPSTPHEANKNVEPHSTKSTDSEDTKWQDSADYSDWVPPQYQSGDGRTHLNDKYGY